MNEWWLGHAADAVVGWIDRVLSVEGSLMPLSQGGDIADTKCAGVSSSSGLGASGSSRCQPTVVATLNPLLRVLDHLGGSGYYSKGTWPFFPLGNPRL